MQVREFPDPRAPDGRPAWLRSRRTPPPPPGAAQPLVSVIVPARGAAGLGQCLDALERQRYPCFEVVVVENGRAAGLDALLPRDPRFRLVREERHGSYRARNAGLQAAAGEVLAFTDADCLPAPDWLERGVAALQGDPDCGLVGGGIDITVGRAGSPTAVELYELRTSFRQREYVERWGFAATANMFTWRRVVDAVGGFDDDLLSMGDREWGSRVTAAGYRAVYSEAARIAHPARSTLRQIGARTRRTTGGFLSLIRAKRWSLRAVVRDVPMGLLPADPFAARASARPEPSSRERLQLLSISAFVAAVRVAEATRLLCGGEPVSR